MAKRFTDTDKWKKEWFLELNPVHKCFWAYLLDNCSAAGIWDVNFRLAAFQIGADLAEAEIRKVFNKQYVEIDGGKRWHIPDFTNFQYGPLSESCKPHARVIAELKKYSIFKGMDSHSDPTSRVEDKEEDKEKEKGIVKGFQKPSLEDLKAFFREKGFPAEAEKFFDYYEANGWRVGRNPMKKWPSAAANWLRNGQSFGSVQKHPENAKPNKACTSCGGGGYAPGSGKKCWCWK